MFITKKNDIFEYTFILSSEEAAFIAEPIVTVKDIDRNLFFNGFAWGESETSMNLESNEFGVVGFSMRFTDIGHYEAIFFEPKTEQKNVVSLEVVSGSIADTNFQNVIYEDFEPGDIINVVIRRASDQLYWNDVTWQSTKIELQMDETNLVHSHEYAFNYSEEETFLIEIVKVVGEESTIEKTYTLDFRKGPFEVKQGIAENVYVISDQTLITKELGVLTDSILKTKDGRFVKDASVKLYVLIFISGTHAIETPFLYHETRTDKNGKWRLFLDQDAFAAINPTEYPSMLIIEKEGFSSQSFKMKPEHFELKYETGGV